MKEIVIYSDYYGKDFRFKLLKKSKRTIDYLMFKSYTSEWREERLFLNSHDVWCVSNTENSLTQYKRRWWVIASCTDYYVGFIKQIEGLRTS
jgi:hypothetical protein